MKNLHKLIAVVVLFIALFVFIITQISMNFVMLGCVAVVLVILIQMNKLYPEPTDFWKEFRNRNTISPLMNPHVGYRASLCILFFTALCLMTLCNYFYADKSIYTNNDHHALKVEGVRIENPRDFILAKNSEEAFFDGNELHGEVVIRDYDTTGVTLKCNNFSHPIYDKTGESNYNMQNIDSSDMLVFKNNDTVTFVNNAGEKIDFWIKEYDAPRKKILRSVKDTASYCFRYNNNIQQSRFSILLTQGYSINGILKGVNVDSRIFDFNGINIIRTHANPKAKNHERSDDEKTQYALEITENAYGIESNKIKEIHVKRDNATICYDLSNTRLFSGEVKVEYERVMFIGYGDGKTRMFSFSRDTVPNSIIIKFVEPLYRQLASNEEVTENTLYITSSLSSDTDDRESDEMIGINVPNNILSYDVFNKSGNVNHFKPFYISFSVGETIEEMIFILDINGERTNYKVCDGSFLIYSKKNDKLSWIVNIENLRDSANAKFDVNALLLTILVIGMISAIMINLNFIGGENVYRYTRNTYSHVEFAAYITVLFLLTIRCFLVWRISVFRPLENISEFELNQFFYNEEHKIYLHVGLILLYASVFAVKLFVSTYKLRFLKAHRSPDDLLETENRNCNYPDPLYTFISKINNIQFNCLRGLSQNRFFILMVVWIIIYPIFSMLFYAVSAVSERFYLVLVVLFYFLTDIVINLLYAKHKNYIDDTHAQDEKYKANAVSVFILTILNMGMACFSLVKDNGFMIMFLSFCFISLCIKLFDLYTKLYQIKSHKLILPYAILSVLVIIVLMFYKKIIILALNSSCFVFLLFVSLALLLYVILYILNLNIKITKRIIIPTIIWCLLLFVSAFVISYVIIFDGNKWLLLPPIVSIIVFIRVMSAGRQTYLKEQMNDRLSIATMWSIIIFGVALGLSFLTFNKNISDIMGGKTTIQRINVQVYDNPSDVMKKIETESDEIAFLRASYNHWIIEQYNNRGENVKPVGERGMGFFKLQPQSKVGAMWGAQLSDILILRYIISEHSGYLPILFLLLFLAMLYFGFRMPTYFRFTKSILIQVPLLLFVQAIIVWMSNTHRFIFLGQDFPLLSIHANVMIFYFFTLVTLWVLMAVLESVANRLLGKTEFENIKRLFVEHSYMVLAAMTFIVLGYSLLNFIKFENKEENSKYSMEDLSMHSMPYVNVIDSLFSIYQKDMKKEGRPLELKNNMHSEIYEFNSKYSNVINEQLRIIAEKNADTSDYHFIQRVWNNYVETGSYNNSFKRIMCIRQDTDTCLKVSLRQDFYDIDLPNNSSEYWRGNIVENYTPIVPKPVIDGSSEDYIYYQIPSSWVKEKHTYHILKKKVESERIVDVFSLSTNRKVRVEDHGIKQVVALFNNDDIVQLDGVNIDHLPIEKRNYWARNILVNGKQMFLYPAGSESYFVRDFATVVKHVEEDRYNKDKNYSADNDVAITLDRKLTSDLYGVFEESVMKHTADKIQRSVIVVDGNGHIKAMVDYKKGFEINPNDDEYISNISEEIFMNRYGDRITRESDYFDDRNLVYLRSGPGSSQKPLVWTAVTSDIKYDWKNLILTKLEVGNTEYAINKINGQKVAKFSTLNSDENYGRSDITLNRYLGHSSNYYSALMVYIGLHSEEMFQNNDFMKVPEDYDDTTRLFRKIKKNPSEMKKEEYKDGYPFMKVYEDKNKINVRLGKPFVREDLYNSVLYKQLTYSFRLNAEYYSDSKKSNSLYPKYDSGNLTKHDSTKLHPAASSINFDRFCNKEDDGFIHDNNIVRSIAIGDEAAWNVTPLKMAEMYVKMMTLNSDFKCSIDPKNVNNDKINIGLNNKDFKDARSVMFNSMNLFFTDGGTGGSIRTRSSTRTKGRGIIINGMEMNLRGAYKEYYTTDREGNVTINPSDCYINVGGKKYYVYGKTGTAGPDNGPQHRRLAIIISDTKMNETLSDGTKPRFYVLYFTFDFKYKGMYDIESYDIIEKVVESDCFQSYMNK